MFDGARSADHPTSCGTAEAIALSTALALTLLTFSCEKEPLEWSTTAEFRIDPKTERHFVELTPTAESSRRTATSAPLRTMSLWPWLIKVAPSS